MSLWVNPGNNSGGGGGGGAPLQLLTALGTTWAAAVASHLVIIHDLPLHSPRTLRLSSNAVACMFKGEAAERICCC
jgi:hypothetical protein